MMPRLVLALAMALVALLAPVTVAADPAADFQRANGLYEEARYADALAAYQALIDQGHGTAAVLANAGTAAWRAGEVGRAVVLYEHALRLDPGNDRAAYNLARITPETNRLPDDTSAFAFAREAMALLPPWLPLVVIEGSFVLLLVALWFWSRTPSGTSARGAWGARVAGAAAALVLALVVALANDAARQRWGEAVLVDKAVSRLGPGEKFFEQLELPPGTLVQLPEPPSGGWVRVRLRDGRTGYVETRHLERF